MNVNVNHIRVDNPEDNSMETLEIVCHLTNREVEVLDEKRGGTPMIQFIKECLNVERPPEYIEEMLRAEKSGREWDARHGPRAEDVRE